jgi:transcriptional regulator with XRE-family HTH domain
VPEVDVQVEAEQLTIRQLAALIGVSASTLRAWEAAGLSSPGLDALGRRRYSSSEIERLREITRLRRGTRSSLSRFRLIIQEVHDLNPAPPTGTADAHVASRLKALRVGLQKTVRQVAEETGLSASFISAVENASTRPSVASLQRLTHAYGITIVSLYDETLDRLPRLIRGDAARTMEFGDSG